MKIKFLTVVVIIVHCSFSQVTVVEDSLFSSALQSTMKFFAVLPDGYTKNHERYPVLYLLHGFGGDYTNWVKLTNLVRYAEAYRFIIITPDAKNSWYTNSSVLRNADYEDYIINDVIPFVEKKYRIFQSKHNRAIAGLSMGGYGAVKFGLKYPAKFFFVGGLSSAIQFPAGLEDSVIVSRRSKELNQSARDMFGRRLPKGSSIDSLSETRTDKWNENDVFVLAEKANVTSLPYFYLSVGSQDGLFEIIDLTHSFAATLRKKKAAFEMHETAGGHNWKFWDKEIEIVLKRMSEIIRKKK